MAYTFILLRQLAHDKKKMYNPSNTYRHIKTFKNVKKHMIGTEEQNAIQTQFKKIQFTHPESF